MKRILTFISILVMAVACETMYGPLQESTDVVKGDGIVVTAKEVKDSSFTFTLAPKGESAFYSYLVAEGSQPQKLDSSLLYTVKYTGVLKGTIPWSKETPSQSVSVTGLKPNTSYVVYAVAGSVTGVPGEISSISVKTTDNVSPAYQNVASEDNMILISFSEVVTRDKASGSIKVPYYAFFSSEFNQECKPAGMVEVPEDSIRVSGASALISVPDLPSGAVYCLNIPEGAFVDAVGNKLPAYVSGFVPGEEGPQPVNFYGEIDTVEYKMFGGLDLESFGDWEAPFLIPISSVYPLAAYGAKVQVVYTNVQGSSVKAEMHTLTLGTDYIADGDEFVIKLPSQPIIGSSVTITIPTGCIIDVYGNKSAEWEYTMLYSYGYEIEDVLGTYVFVENSYYGGQYQSVMTLTESDVPDLGNVMFTVFDNYECIASPIYATFDTDAGTLTIPSMQVFSIYKNAYYTCFVEASISDQGAGFIEKGEVVMKVPEPGVLNSSGDPLGVLLLTPSFQPYGWYDVYTEYSGERVEDAGEAQVKAKAANQGRKAVNAPVLK